VIENVSVRIGNDQARGNSHTSQRPPDVGYEHALHSRYVNLDLSTVPSIALEGSLRNRGDPGAIF